MAVVKGEETYDLLKTSCSEIFACVNKLVKDGVANVEGKNIPVQMHLGGDYKVF